MDAAEDKATRRILVAVRNAGGCLPMNSLTVQIKWGSGDMMFGCSLRSFIRERPEFFSISAKGVHARACELHPPYAQVSAESTDAPATSVPADQTEKKRKTYFCDGEQGGAPTQMAAVLEYLTSPTVKPASAGGGAQQVAQSTEAAEIENLIWSTSVCKFTPTNLLIPALHPAAPAKKLYSRLSGWRRSRLRQPV